MPGTVYFSDNFAIEAGTNSRFIANFINPEGKWETWH